MIVVVTVVILLVTLAAYGFVSVMEVENRAAFARGDQLQADAVGLSGREYLAAILEQPRDQRPSAGAAHDPTAGLMGGVLVDGDPNARDLRERQGRFALLAGSLDELSAQGWGFGFENESARLHLGMVLEWDRQQPGAGRAALLSLPGMDEAAADAILDWIDADDVARDQGAESAYYAGLDPPLRPRNAVPPSLDELLLVRGVTRERLFGLDRDASFDIQAWERELAGDETTSLSESTKLPWTRYLTVYSGERDETQDGRPRILLNQPDLSKLHQELSAAFDPAWANFAVAYRQYGPYAGNEEGADASALAVDFAQPAQHILQSPLELIAARVARPTGQKDEQEVFASPLVDDPGRMRDDLPKWMDRVTVGDGSPIAGRVNVNLAPREVLRAIPGFDGAVADRVMSARTLIAPGDLARSHAVWLLTEGIVDREQMQRIEPWVTTGGDVGRAQIVGYYDRRGAFARFETVVDGTVRPARQVYYKDLRPLGRGVLGDVINLTSKP